MPFEYEIVCLANSWKHGGRCIAGKVVSGQDAGRWIRPVGNRVGHREIRPPEMHYGQGRYAAVLDTIRIEFNEREQGTFQCENMIISGARWVKTGQIRVSDIGDWLDEPEALWENGSRSTFGSNDKIDSFRLRGPRSSLCLIVPENPRIRVGPEHGGATKVRVLFEYNDIEYALTATDAQVLETYRNMAHGTYALDDVRGMTISLGEPLPATGDSYKLVAHIF